MIYKTLHRKPRDRATWTPLKTGGELTVKRHEQTHYYNRYKNLVGCYDVRLIWMQVDIKILLPLFGQFSEIIVYSFVCAVWSRQGYEELIQLASKTIIYYDKMSVQIYIYNMNKLFLHFNEEIRMVLVGFLLILKQPCPQ